ncbi:MAG: UDP-N-acetylmuramoyl-tripeptide--D-alanyl-D-alanine ligase [Alphaproteobacteria bacterium]|nr:UDP-N-acetylmuramoyl-tripeptide--D-alanyl-D-alanine ligase [Alphaproteobacteria bacterium]
MNSLWTSSATIKAVEGICTRKDDWRATSVEIDSRKVTEGSLFFAIIGPNNDGHDYLKNVASQGAVAAIVAKDRLDKYKDINLPLVVVEDTTKALYDLASAARDRMQGKVIAITGSVGKTGTKEGLKAAFSELGKTHATEGNLNNDFGLPLTMCRMPQDSDFSILEMGMNHADEIRPLSKLARPHLAIITTVAPVHIEFFSGIQGIADAKAEIFEGLDENGKCILLREHGLFHHLRARARDLGIKNKNILTFGSHESALYRLTNLTLSPTVTTIEANLNGKSLTYEIFMPGDHWAINSLSILAAVDALDGDITLAAQGFKNWHPGKGRGQRYEFPLPKGGNALLIDESYNASPPAMKAAFRILADIPTATGKKIAVLGDMLELGDAGKSLHLGLAKELESAQIDAVYCCGPLMREMYDALPSKIRKLHLPDSSELFEKVLSDLCDGDIVLVKGSLGSRMVPVSDSFIALSS